MKNLEKEAEIEILKEQYKGFKEIMDVKINSFQDVLTKGFNDMGEKIDNMLISQNGKFRMMDDRITAESKRIDVLEDTIKKNEQCIDKIMEAKDNLEPFSTLGRYLKNNIAFIVLVLVVIIAYGILTIQRMI